MTRVRSALRAEYLLPIACLVAAACVAAAEFSTIFEYNRGTSGEPLLVDEAADRHYYALLVLAVFAVVALAIAVLTGSRPAAAAVAVAGGISLLIFLLVDLPDVNVEGALSEPYFFSSKAEPAGGFWLELIGTVSLALAGGALATLRSDQLQALVPERYRGAEGTTPAERKQAADLRNLSAKPTQPAEESSDGPDPAARAAARRRERAG